MKENKEEAAYPRMVVLNYSNFNIEITEQEVKQLKIIFLRILQKIRLGLFHLKPHKLHARNA